MMELTLTFLFIMIIVGVASVAIMMVQIALNDHADFDPNNLLVRAVKALESQVKIRSTQPANEKQLDPPASLRGDYGDIEYTAWQLARHEKQMDLFPPEAEVDPSPPNYFIRTGPQMFRYRLTHGARYSGQIVVPHASHFRRVGRFSKGVNVHVPRTGKFELDVGPWPIGTFESKQEDDEPSIVTSSEGPFWFESEANNRYKM